MANKSEVRYVSDATWLSPGQRAGIIAIGGDFEADEGESFESLMCTAKSFARVEAMADPNAKGPRETEIPWGFHVVDD